jgi:hypothetical protein
MGLRDIIIKRTKVEMADGQSFDVRGLAAMDVMALVHTHGKALALAFGKITAQGKGQPVNELLVREMLASVGSDFPEVLAAIIALASDAYDEQGIRTASQLNMLTQINAATAIFHLSFTSETEVKKLVESLAGAVTMISASLTTPLPSLDGISASAAA